MNSCAPVQPLTDPASVVQAVCNVAERSFFAFAEPADAASADTLAPAGTRAMSASVRFSGPCAGVMHVTMAVELTRELAALFSGDPDLTFSDADLTDMAGEFGNMVTGAWLTAADATSTFDLAAPVVTYVDVLPHIDIPTLLVWGAESNFYTLATAQYLLKHILQVRLQCYEGADHFPQLQQPDRFARELLALVAEGRSAGEACLRRC